MQKEYLFNRIQTGGKVQAVGFWPAAPKLPTADEAREITQSAINGALAIVCGSEPQPEDLSMEVSLATAMRLEGRFALKMDWKPKRDCR
ncbi:MAG TPA: hypothetical protein VJ942_04645 [Roseovarius sp.]|nr:hypothetical protein [Roseovarius sp.]